MPSWTTVRIVAPEVLWTIWCTVAWVRQAEGNRAPGHPQHRGSDGFDCCPQRHENSCFVWCWWRITMTSRAEVPPPGCSKTSLRQHLILNIDRFKAVVPVLFLFCVDLWFMLRSASCFKVFPCSLLDMAQNLHHFPPFSICYLLYSNGNN